MAKKITQYPASLGNPDANSLIDISEYASNAYVTKKLTITQLLAYLNTNLQFTPVFTFKNVSGATIFKGTPCEISNVSSGTTSVVKIASSNTATGQIFIPNADVLNNANGVFITNGLLTPFDTTPYAIGAKLYWNVTTSTITSVAQDDMIFIGVVLNVSATGSIFVAPSLNPSKVKGAVGQIALFSDDRNVKSENRFSYIDNVGTEVGFRFSDTNNNLTKIGVTLIDVQTQGLYDSKISLNQYGTNSNRSRIELKKARGTLAAPIKVIVNDVLGEIDFSGGLDSLVNGINPVTSIVNTAQVIVKALTNFQKDYDSFNNDTTANAHTELAIWLQGSNQLIGGNAMPTNTKVFWVNGDGKINFLNYNFPITAGTNGQSLVTDASGNITWQTISPNISLASEQVAFGNASNLISSTSNFKFYVSNIANPTNQRSAIFLVSTENDYTGQTYYGALRIKQQSSECLNVFDQVNAITNLSKGSIIRLGTYDSSLGSGIFMPNNQSIGELDFGVNDSLIGAKIKAFTEQIVNGGNIGTRLEFYVTPLNSITPALALKIDNTGKVYFKNYNFPLAAGTINQALVTDGSGNITFQTLFNTPTIANSVPYYDALTTKFLSSKLYWDNAASSFKWDNEINTMFNNKLHMAFYNTGTIGNQDSIYHGINFQAYNNSVYDGATIRVGHMRGVIGASQHLQNFDVIGKIHFNASDNVNGYTAAMWGRATENHTLTSKGSSITFETTPNGLITPEINLVINNNGQIYFKNYKFPVLDGTAGTSLITDGLGNINWGTPSVGASSSLQTIGRNSTGVTLFAGTIVYILGSTGNRPNFVKARADIEPTSSGTFGVVVSDIANNSDGYVVTTGAVSGLDTRVVATHPFTTDTLVDGDIIYLSPTIAGYVTNIKPSAPNHIVSIGNVIQTSPTNGTIVYRIQNGYELDEIHDVQIGVLADNDILQYELSTGLWKNKPNSTTTNQAFSPMPISVCDTAPTANTTQYYYQTTSEITGSINRMKIWGFSGADTCFVGVYRGTLGGTKTLIGVGTAVCSVGANDIVLTAKAGQTLDLIAGENLIVGFYPNGTSFRSIYDVGVADLNFGIENTGNLSTELPATPTGTASAIRFACTLFKV